MKTLANIGTSLGLGMMVVGVFGRAAAKRSPKADPMHDVLDEGGGAFIVFGAAIAALSVALSEPQSKETGGFG